MPIGILAATFVAAFAAFVALPINLDLTNAIGLAQNRPDCARPSSVSGCSGPEQTIACAKEGTCRDITGELTQGCLGYVCKTEQGRAEQLQEELKAYEEAKKRAEQGRQREEDKRRAEEAQGPPPPEPVPSGGAGAGTAASPPPCVGQGGGADDCLGSGGMVVPGVKTAPGNFDIYKK